ncbi:MAG: hypothetical protein WCE21_02480 [Candidatus Babeliales bacterium]
MKTETAGSLALYLAGSITILMLAAMGSWHMALHTAHALQEQSIAIQLRSVARSCMHYALHHSMQSSLLEQTNNQSVSITATFPLFNQGPESSVFITIQPNGSSSMVLVIARLQERAIKIRTCITVTQTEQGQRRYVINPWIYG